jgi:hypothetical protein
LVVLCSLVLGTASAQVSIRPSETGSMAATARQQTELSTSGYLFKMGPVLFNASAATEFQYNDNVTLAQKGREGDFITFPSLNLGAAWQATPQNTLRLDLGLAYAAYAKHSELDTHSVLIDPGSKLAFDIYVGGVLRLTVYDEFAILQNPIDEPTLSNVARFDRFQNSSGVTGLFDFNDLKIVVGYNHFFYKNFGDDFNFLDRNEEQFFTSVSLRFSDALTAGVDANAAIINYRQNINNNGTMWSTGPFVEAVLSQYTRLRLTAGYQGTDFRQTGTNGDTSNYQGWYGNLTVSHRFNQFWTHSLAVGNEARLGLEVNYYRDTYVRYLAECQLNPQMTLGIDAFFENADESGGPQQNPEHAKRWGSSASLVWRLSNRLSAELRYGYVRKSSDLELRSYYQNVGTIGFKFQF